MRQAWAIASDEGYELYFCELDIVIDRGEELAEKYPDENFRLYIIGDWVREF